MTSSQYLPEEIMVEIFSRLPTKSVGKCRCLSKSWNSRLSTSKFINSHLISRNKTNQQNILLLTLSLHTITTSVEDNWTRVSVDGRHSRVFRNPPSYHYAVSSTKLDLHDTWNRVWGSCNGLVLLETKERDLYLVNPVTRQKVMIPVFDLALKKILRSITYGFGYDSCSDDYKIVSISYYKSINFGFGGANSEDTVVDVYYVKMGVWKRVDKFPCDNRYPPWACGAFVNGAIHWLASTKYSVFQLADNLDLEARYPSLIVAFDLASEVFYEVPAPPCGIHVLYNTLSVLGGRLCLADGYHRSRIDVWMLEEYGVVESWMRKFGSGENDVWNARPKLLCFVGEDEVVLETHGTYLIVQNVKDQTSRYLVVDGKHEHAMILYKGMDAFVDSLVSVWVMCGT